MAATNNVLWAACTGAVPHRDLWHPDRRDDLVAVPFLWAIINSIKTLNETFQTGAIIPFLQFRPTLDSWNQALNGTGVPTPSLQHRGQQRRNHAGAGDRRSRCLQPRALRVSRLIPDITLWSLSQRVLHPPSCWCPFYLMMVFFGLIDTWTGLIISYSTFSLAFGVVIMGRLPRRSKEVEEAAKVRARPPGISPCSSPCR